MRVVSSPRSASRTVSAAAPVLERSAVMSTDVSRTVRTKSMVSQVIPLFGQNNEQVLHCSQDIRAVTRVQIPSGTTPVDSPPFPFPDWIYEAHPTSAPRTAIPIPNVRARHRQKPHKSLRMGCRQLRFQHLGHEQLSGLI